MMRQLTRVLPLVLVALTLASSPLLAEGPGEDEKKVVVTLRPIRSIQLTDEQAKQAKAVWDRAELERGLLTLRENTLVARRGYSLWEDERGGKFVLPIPAANPGTRSEIRIEFFQRYGRTGLRYVSCKCEDNDNEGEDNCALTENPETLRTECSAPGCKCVLDITELMLTVW